MIIPNKKHQQTAMIQNSEGKKKNKICSNICDILYDVKE